MTKFRSLSPEVVAQWRARARRARLAPAGVSPEEIAAYCERVRAFWTPERRAAAVPPPGWESHEAAIEAELTKAPDPVKVPKSQLSNPPYSSAGKFLFQFRTGGMYHRASAFAVGSDLVMTAGHCVVERATKKRAPNPAINVLFEPQYVDGDSPIGSFAGLDVFYLDEWAVVAEDAAWDVAFARVAPLPTAQVPALALDFTQPGPQQIMQLGYPVVEQFRGSERMWSSTSTYKQRESRTMSWLRVPSELTGGASGGPWLDSENNAVSLNSSRIVKDDKTWVDGPVFGEAAQVLFEYASQIAGVWAVNTDCGNYPTSVLYVESQNTVYVGVRGYIYAYDPATGAQTNNNSLGGYGKNEIRLATDEQSLFIGINGYVLGLSFSNFGTVNQYESMTYGGPTTVLYMPEGNVLYAGAGSQVCMISGGTVSYNKLTGIQGNVVGLAASSNWLYAGTGGQVTPLWLLAFTQPGPWTTQISSDNTAPVSVAAAGSELYAGSGGIVAQLLGMPGGENTSNNLNLGDNEVRLAVGLHHVYAACNGVVAAFARNGIQNGPLWTTTLASGGGVTNLLLLESSVLVGCGGLIYQVSNQTGTILLSFSLGSGATGEVRMSLGSQGAMLYAGCSGYVFGVALALSTSVGASEATVSPHR